MSRTLSPHVAVGFGVAVLLAAMYGATAAPGLYWADSAEFTAVAQTAGVAHPPGYPLYSLALTALWRACGSVWVLNWCSGLASAAALGLLASAATRGQRWAAAVALGLAILTVGCGGTWWQNSTVAEVYGLHLLLASALVFLAVRPSPDPCGAAAPAVFGLGLAHHPLIIAFAPLVLPALGRGARRHCIQLLAMLAPLALYACLQLASSQQPPFDWGNPQTWPNLLYHVTARQYAHLTAVRPPLFVLAVLGRALQQLPQELPLPLLLLAPVELWFLWRQRRALAWTMAATLVLGLLLASATAAALNPPYFLAVWALLGYLGAAGIGRMLAQPRAGRWVGAACIVLTVLYGLCLAVHNWPACNQRGNDAPTRYADALLQALPADSVLITYSDSLSNLTLQARLVRGVRPDVDIISTGDLVSVDSGQTLSRNFPRLVLPPDGYAFPQWPRRDPRAYLVEDQADFVRLLLVNNARRPLLAEFAPGLEWLARDAVPFGHLVRLAPGATPTTGDLRAHWRLWRRLEEAARGQLARDEASRKPYVLAANSLGWYWLERGDSTRALQAFAEALRYDPCDAGTHGNLAGLYARLGDAGPAEAHFAAARGLAPWDAQLEANYAVFLTERGDLPGAARARARARALGYPPLPNQAQ
ncbi:DUF2723 domain-containing protein [bacterium]|nr:DUF2723 domain-containing protein [bacterium]